MAAAPPPPSPPRRSRASIMGCCSSAARTSAKGGANVSKIDFTTSPTGDLVGGGGAAGSTTLSILPYVVGTSSGNGAEPDRPVTIGASGLRPLTTGELHNGIESAGNLDNVIVTDSTPVQALPYTKTINAIYAVPQG